MTKDRQEIIASFDAFDYQSTVKIKRKIIRELVQSVRDRTHWLDTPLKLLAGFAVIVLVLVIWSYIEGLLLAISARGFLKGLEWVGILLKAH